MSYLANIKNSLTGLKNRLYSFGFPKPQNGKENIIINHTTVQPVKRDTQDIQKWRNALQAAESHSQNRARLYNLYEDVLIDGYCSMLIEKRIAAITNKEITFTRKGKKIEDVVSLSEKTFFENFLKFTLEAKFYGHSLVQMYWADAKSDPNTSSTELVNRRHVKPRFGIVTEHENGMEGINYREDAYKAVSIEIGDNEDLGLILKCCPHVIVKRGNFGDWAEFAEIFGMPFRWATYQNETSRQNLEAQMAAAGAAGYVVAPEDAKLQFMNGATAANSDIFSGLREAMNEELSITILGNSMTTTEAKHSGYAQSKTHAESQEEIHASDKKFVLRILNEKLLPYLERLGYNVKGGKFSFVEDEIISLKERIVIDMQLNQVVEIGENYWYEKYGIPKPSTEELAKLDARKVNNPNNNPDNGNKPGENNPPQKKKANMTDNMINLNDYYNNTCSHANLNDLSTQFNPIPDDVIEAYYNKVYKGELTINEIDEALYTEYYNRFKQFAEAGLGNTFDEAATDLERELITKMRDNISEMAAAKARSFTEQVLYNIQTGETLETFMERSKAISRQYNLNWLQTELRTTTQAASMAAKWQDIIADDTGLYPNLRYITAGDELVREAHKALNNIVRPINDPFWNSNYPPLGWNCRCDVEQTDEDTTDTPDPIKIQKGFNSNVGQTGKIFDEEHPYFANIPEKDKKEVFKQASNYLKKIES